jgi:hypothetical protein
MIDLLNLNSNSYSSKTKKIYSLVEFCGDQHGSRFIQQQLETCSAEGLCFLGGE